MPTDSLCSVGRRNWTSSEIVLYLDRVAGYHRVPGCLFKHTTLFNVQYKIKGNIIPVQNKEVNEYSSSIIFTCI